MYLFMMLTAAEQRAKVVGVCSVWESLWNEVVYLLFSLFKDLNVTAADIPFSAINRIRVWVGDVFREDSGLLEPPAAALEFFPDAFT